MTAQCDCWKHERQVCDVCQGPSMPDAPTEERGEGMCDDCLRYDDSPHNHANHPLPQLTPSPESPAAEETCNGVTPPHDECAGGECARAESPAARLRREAHEALDECIARLVGELAVQAADPDRNGSPRINLNDVDAMSDALHRAILAAARKEAP